MKEAITIQCILVPTALICAWAYHSVLALLMPPRAPEKRSRLAFLLLYTLWFSLPAELLPRPVRSVLDPLLTILLPFTAFPGSIGRHMLGSAIFSTACVSMKALSSVAARSYGWDTSAPAIPQTVLTCLLVCAFARMLVPFLRRLLRVTRIRLPARYRVAVGVTCLVALLISVTMLLNIACSDPSQNGQTIRMLRRLELAALFIPPSLLILLLGLIGSLDTAMQEREAARIREQLVREALERDRATLAGNEKLLELRRDLHRHLHTIAVLGRSGDLDGQAEYIAELRQTLEQTRERVYTGHALIDCILSRKLRSAEEASVNVALDVSPFAPQLPITDVELCTLLGNLLDNAITAAAGSDDRRLQIVLRMNEQLLTLRILNSCNDPQTALKHIRQRRRTDPEHGFGFRNAQRVARKHYGALLAEEANGGIQVSAMLSLASGPRIR